MRKENQDSELDNYVNFFRSFFCTFTKRVVDRNKGRKFIDHIMIAPLLEYKR